MYWRYSSFYFFYFAALGTLWPYWGPYLKSLGYGETDIGELVAIVMVTKVLAPYIWGWVADHTGRRMRVVRVTSLLAAVSFAAIFFDQGYTWLLLVMAIYSFFWNAALPQFEATTLTQLGERTQHYSSIRLWGSIGFIVAVASLGPVVGHFGMSVIPWVFLVLLVIIWLASLGIPELVSGSQLSGHEPIAGVLRQSVVIALFVICFLLQASHGPYYTFYSIYLQEFGYSFNWIGGLWALGVLAEVVVFFFMYRLLPRYGERWLMVASLILTTLRWLMIGFGIASPVVLILAQFLHAASFGVYHAVAISLIHRYFAGRHQGRGQALYSSLSFGAGGACGSVVSGYLWLDQGPSFTFSMAAIASLMATILAWRMLPAMRGVRGDD